MVEKKLEKILNKIKEDRGSVRLFAIIKVGEEATDKWSLVLSGDWVNESNLNTNFGYIFGLLSRYLTDDEKSSIARIGIFTEDEKLVQLITNTVTVEAGSTAHLKENKFNGYYIHEAYIFESHAQ